eukprot:TRINITY_DN23877_c0_g1_i1.p2 TRINITY_DN23877_c0_g1~~TRINITY_DN23877_c0_g1_i1.p2  ORF type:complete len:189 (-),score=21.23 TRINITY_DN23877_c0_g1_i1:23-589(-)
MRDHLHIRYRLFELAERAAVYLGTFSAVHIRRTDFGKSYPEQLQAAAMVADNIRIHLRPDSETLYVASDDGDDRYFEQLSLGFSRVAKLHNILHIFRGEYVPPKWHPVLEQLICARARIFVGTRLSTFSGYVVRLRGHLGQRNTESYFIDTQYTLPTPKIHEDWPYSWSSAWSHAIWGREYPEGWCAR